MSIGEAVLVRLLALLFASFFVVAPALAQITLAPASLPNPAVGVPYHQLFTVLGGTPPYTVSLAGPLPAGMTFSGGALSGTPTESGTFNFSVFASDFASATDSNSYTLTVGAPTISMSPASLPTGAVGNAYSQNLLAFGGTAPYTFSFSGVLPSGITLTPTGLVSGTPLAAGSYTFSVMVTDSSTGNGPHTASISQTLVIAPPSVSLSPTLPDATVGQPYAQMISASGGLPPYAFSLDSGALPVGLLLGPDGSISGTAEEDGTFSFTVSARDSTSGTPITGSQTYSLDVAPPTVTLSPASLPDGRAGAPYSAAIAASGGTAPYTYTVTGTLPPGVTLSSSGLLSGTPNESDFYSFTVMATDSRDRKSVV